MTTAIYLRVSSKGQSHASQEPELKAWAQANGESTCYRDKVTGTTLNRPGWQKLYSDIQSGKVNRLVIWRLDRLGRSLPDMVNLLNEPDERKVQIISVKDGNLSADSASGRLFRSMLVAFARTRTGRERGHSGLFSPARPRRHRRGSTAAGKGLLSGR